MKTTNKSIKKILSTALCLALVMSYVPMVSLTAFAADEYTEGVFKYTVQDGKATITKYTGYDEILFIPKTLGGYSVTSIGNSAFQSCTNLTEITIPDSVTSIGYCAFSSCKNLTEITIPDSVTVIGNEIFSFCKSLTKVNLSNNLTIIGTYMFESCKSLKSIIIPDSVTEIDTGAFKSCTNLTEITIPDSVTSISVNAFKSCDSLNIVHYLGSTDSWDEIAIGNENNTLLTSAQRHYCTKEAVTVEGCDINGDAALWYCSDCSKYIFDHDWANNDSVCAVCGYKCPHNEFSSHAILPVYQFSSGGFEQEGADKLFDGNADTKWCSEMNGDVYFIFGYNDKVKITSYTLTPGADTPSFPGRNWTSWTLYGADSVDGEWKSVHTVNNANIPSDRESDPFTVNSDVAFQYYKFVVNTIGNQNTQQMSEISIVGDETILGCVECGYYCYHPNYNKGLCDVCGYKCLHEILNNGLCDICGSEPAVDSNNDGYYEIDNVGKLFWFAQEINSGNTGLNGILTADINLGNREWTPIGTADAKFTGTFDGNGKSITGFKITATTAGVYGLFGYIQNATVKNFSIDGSVTVNQPEKMDFYFGVVGSAHADAGKNVIIDDVISDIDVTVLDSNMKNSVAGIVGTASAAIGTGGSWDGWGRVYVRKCAYTGSINMGNATVDCGGGIIGYVGYNIAAYIENNLYAGSFTGPGGQVGGIVGYNNGKNMNVVNCLSIGALNLTDSYFVGAIGGRYINQLNDKVDSVVKNNYYTGDLPAFSNNPDATNDLVDLGNFDGGNALNVTTEQVKSGEIAIRLGSAWGQTMGSQEHPVPNGQKVYQVSHCGKTVYSNTNSSWDHAYDSEGFCTKTEGETHYQPAADTNADGYYEIGNAGQLFWFAEQINNEGVLTPSSKAVLTADIDLKNKPWIPICSTGLYYTVTTYPDTGYTGIFDGAGHVISGLNITGSAADASFGLFGTLSGTVKNLGIDTFTFIGAGGDTRVGAVVGQMLDGSLVENCYAIHIHINTTVNTTNGVAGGIAGCNYAATVRNCYVSDLTVSAGRYGGIVGDNRADGGATDRPGVLENCYTDYGTFHDDRNVGTSATGNAAVKSDQFKSGEIAYLLSQGENDGVWGQNSNTEGSYPILTDNELYKVVKIGETGNYSVSNVGDANNDGVIDVNDYQALVNKALAESHEQIEAAGYDDIIRYDLDGDGYLNVIDASIMERLVNGHVTVDVYAVGDYDCNGKAFEEADILAMAEAMKSPAEMTTQEKYACDLSADGIINEEDKILLDMR